MDEYNPADEFAGFLIADGGDEANHLQPITRHFLDQSQELCIDHSPEPTAKNALQHFVTVRVNPIPSNTLILQSNLEFVQDKPDVSSQPVPACKAACKPCPKPSEMTLRVGSPKPTYFS